MTDKELIEQYIEKHGVTKIPAGVSGLPEVRWCSDNPNKMELREVKPDGTFYTRPEALRLLARRRQAKFKAYALGLKIKRAERA